MPARGIKVGTFALRTGTGTQAVTGLGVQPVGLMLFWSGCSVTGFTDFGALMWYGFTDGTRHLSSTHLDFDNTAGSGGARSYHNSALQGRDASTVYFQGTVQSFDADGFTLSWTTNGVAGHLITYVAFYGSGVSCYATEFLSPASAGAQTVTGWPFQPDLIFFQNNDWTTLATAVVGTQFSGPTGFGVSAGSGGQCTHDWSSLVNGVFTVNRYCYFARATQDGQAQQLNVTSHNADGFTGTWAGSAMGAGKYIAFAVKGLTGVVSTLTQPGTNGTASFAAGAGKTPVGLITFSSGQTGQNGTGNADSGTGTAAVGTVAMWGTNGFYDGTSQVCLATGENQVSGNTACVRYQQNGEVAALVSAVNAAGGSTTKAATLAATGISGSNVNVSWTVTDAVARLVAGLVLVNPTGGGGGGGGGQSRSSAVIGATIGGGLGRGGEGGLAGSAVTTHDVAPGGGPGGWDLMASYNRFSTVTPSDSVNLDPRPEALYIGTGGDLTVVAGNGETKVFKGAQAGSIIPIQVMRVNSTGTTAADLLGCFRL